MHLHEQGCLAAVMLLFPATGLLTGSLAATPASSCAVLPPCGAVHAARRSMLSSWRASRQQAALAGSVVGSSERPAGPGMSLLAMLPAALPAAAAAVDEEAAAAPAAGMRPGV